MASQVNSTKHTKRNLYPSSLNFLKREEKFQINNLTHHLNELEKEEPTKPKVSRRKEIIKIKEEINKIEILKNNRKKSIKPRTGSLKR